ncbi:MAG TPA: hypothetical protein PLZ57_07125 [Pseudobdellovibrionaceae bacterium]|nr:hypothetical protein [Pseudobdellovibrionaceae bacterium]
MAFGFWTMMIFTSGFLGGLVLWWFFPSSVDFARLRAPYWIALALFLVHRVEEKMMGFFSFLSGVTGVSTPEITSWPVITLVLISVGAWLSIPILVKRRKSFGYYLAWTFFASMGITELAHWLVFPFFVDHPATYIPGMASVVPLAPVAWWGMSRLKSGSRN